MISDEELQHRNDAPRNEFVPARSLLAAVDQENRSHEIRNELEDILRAVLAQRFGILDERIEDTLAEAITPWVLVEIQKPKIATEGLIDEVAMTIADPNGAYEGPIERFWDVRCDSDLQYEVQCYEQAKAVLRELGYEIKEDKT